MLSEEQKQEYWADQIEQWQASGKSAAAWCREQKLVYHQFFYWKKRLAPKEEAFVELEEPADTGITLEIGQIRIEVTSNFDLKTLERLIRVLQP